MTRKTRTESYAVAFIDFLGVKDMIANDTSGDLLIIFRAACKSALHMCKKILNDQDEVTIKMFSDNIVLCKRVYNPATHTEDRQGAMRRVILAASMFQYFILDTMGTLLRGGITVGELYIDNMMVWGQALVDAYRMESEIALYPRIIVDPKLAETDLCTPFIESESIVKDEDGLYYLNYIHTVWKFRKLKSHSDEADKLIEKSNASHVDLNDSTTVAVKRQWQINYLESMRQIWSEADNKAREEAEAKSRFDAEVQSAEADEYEAECNDEIASDVMERPND